MQVNSKKSKFYVSFSIHGSCCFITAIKETSDYVINHNITTGRKYAIIDGIKFKIADSRRANYSVLKDGYKLHYPRLLTKEGDPLKAPGLIISRFKELEKLGWVVTRKSFTERWFGQSAVKNSNEKELAEAI